MSDWFYKLVRSGGYPAFGTSGSPVVLHVQRLERFKGALIVAPNHLSAYDVPCLMASTRRVLDFVSIVELFQRPLSAWFFRNIGALPLDRWHPDSPTVRAVRRRLEQGRILVMFPEGRLRTAADSLLAGGDFKPGVTRLAAMTGVPIMPCVILGTSAYRRPASWLPLRRTVYALNFGMPLRPPKEMDRAAAGKWLEQALRSAYARLFDELTEALRRRGRQLTVDELGATRSITAPFPEPEGV